MTTPNHREWIMAAASEVSGLFGTNRIPDDEIADIIEQHFDRFVEEHGIPEPTGPTQEQLAIAQIAATIYPAGGATKGDAQRAVRSAREILEAVRATETK